MRRTRRHVKAESIHSVDQVRLLSTTPELNSLCDDLAGSLVVSYASAECILLPACVIDNHGG